MFVSTLPYSKTGYFSSIVTDYLSEKKNIQPFYSFFPKQENFLKQLQLKKPSFTKENREVLVQQLQAQYKGIKMTAAVEKNMASLLKDTTFTITTGHQLNLFTGPLYFLYKIFSVINLAEKLSKEHPDNHFVPVYWMATEDHDFEEINYFNLFGKKIQWNHDSGGAVGDIETDGLEAVLAILKAELGTTEHAVTLTRLFSEGYLKHNTLTEATRYIADKLFSTYGLVVIDGNDRELKKAFVPYAQKELTENLSYQKVTATTQKLTEAGYKEQVHPREINLFYLSKGSRDRIVEQEGTFFVKDTSISFTKQEILQELQEHPERFSPNALLRPLYQEVILPNLCYVGGGGELAYWFQLKEYFEAVQVPFPILLLRNSVLLLPLKLSEKLKKLGVEKEALFLEQETLKTRYTHQLSAVNIDFTAQKEFLKQQFKDLYTLAEQTDASFKGAVAAQEQKQINGLTHLEKRLLKAQKRKLNDSLERLLAIQDAVFPHQSLQERTVNFSEMYLAYGEELFKQLKENLDPLQQEFTIIEM